MMRAAFAFTWVAGCTALTLFSSGDARLCRGFLLVAAAWGIAMALGQRTRVARDYYRTVLAMAGSYALLVGVVWAWGGVVPDTAYLATFAPYLLAGMLAPGACLEAGSIAPPRAKWLWLGLFVAMALVIEANNLGWIDYSRIRLRWIWVGWGIWTEKYYIYWLLLLVWAVVSRFSSRTKTDRWVVLGLLAFTAMLIVASGRSLRALGIFACGVAVYFLLTKVAVSRRRLKFGLLALLVWWGAAPWLFNAVDFSKVDRRINERTRIYRATHDLVAQQPWLGHGFGRARELTHPLLPRRFQQHFPGGHPHNLGLLFWLEYGLVGAVWLCGVTWILLRRVIDAAHGTEIWPALAALIVTFVTMVSFSWDIWDLNIILFYAAAAGLVILVLGSIQSSAAGLTDGEKGRS